VNSELNKVRLCQNN